MEIGSKSGWPSSALSNFAPHEFELDGVKCASFEGFVQSLKFKAPDMQVEVCKLVGLAAKYRGKPKKWWKTGTLYWRGEAFSRFGDDYQKLLDRAYSELSKNISFQKALLATNNAVLKHSIGKNDPKRTVLTISEFCGRLTRIRDELRKGQK